VNNSVVRLAARGATGAFPAESRGQDPKDREVMIRQCSGHDGTGTSTSVRTGKGENQSTELETNDEEKIWTG